MHDADFEFELTQAGRRFASQQATTYDDNRFLQVPHLAQSERVTNRSQIDDVAQAHSRDWWPHRTAAHGQACLVELDGFAISQNCEPPVDIHLCDRGCEPCLYFVGVVPAWIQIRQFF